MAIGKACRNQWNRMMAADREKRIFFDGSATGWLLFSRVYLPADHVESIFANPVRLQPQGKET
jgi:hypothetical protein